MADCDAGRPAVAVDPPNRPLTTVPLQTVPMRIEYDRDTCIGMFQCVAEWDAFERDVDAGKAVLVDGEETEANLFVREVPEDAELDAKFAARACPVDAIAVYDDDGEQIV
jgi:ferredoxin